MSEHERKHLTASADSWHGRVYLKWRDERSVFKNRGAYKENLCHYCRVILFWAPLNWFIKASPWEHSDEPRALVTPLAAVAVFIGGAFGIRGAILHPHQALVVLLWIVGFVIGFIIIIISAISIGELVDRRRMRGAPVDPGMFTLLYRRAQAKKARVCPFIDIQER